MKSRCDSENDIWVNELVVIFWVLLSLSLKTKLRKQEQLKTKDFKICPWGIFYDLETSYFIVILNFVYIFLTKQDSPLQSIKRFIDSSIAKILLDVRSASTWKRVQSQSFHKKQFFARAISFQKHESLVL